MNELKELPANFKKQAMVDVLQFRGLVHERNELFQTLQKITQEASTTAHDNPRLASAIVEANEVLARLK